MNKQLIAFNVMTAVQSSYAAEGLSDSEFAKKLTAILKTDISTARVRQARVVLGIPNNGPVDKLKEAKQHILKLLETPTLETVRYEAREFANGL